MTTEHRDALARALTEMAMAESRYPAGTNFRDLADAILADLQSLLDALAAAGLLRFAPSAAVICYWAEVERPHVHDWERPILVHPEGHGEPRLIWRCSICRVERSVPIARPAEDS